MEKMKFFEKIYDEVFINLVLILSITFIKLGSETWHYKNLFFLIYIFVVFCCYHFFRKFMIKLVPLDGDIKNLKAKKYLSNVTWIVRIVVISLIFLM
ncbi:hypothetical protein COE53_18015 [Bacillus sp. AFS029533]|nr:hypothetical protein COE53_18015 [Bacillus sp. AFS029533]